MIEIMAYENNDSGIEYQCGQRFSIPYGHNEYKLLK